jgi:hypothetical protein
MIGDLIGLIVAIVVVGIVAGLIAVLVDMIEMDARFKKMARVLIMLVAVLIILAHALPLLGVSILAPAGC